MHPRPTPVSRFISEILDRNGDGRLDATPEQLAKLQDKSSATLSPSAAAAFITDVFTCKDSQDMNFSGYTAHHVIQKLGVTVTEGQIPPQVFKASVENFLNDGVIPEPRYITQRVVTSEVTDPYCVSNHRRVPVTHVSASLRFDFDAQQISGTATYTLGRQEKDVLILDTESITPTSAWVVLKDQPDERISTAFHLGSEKPFLGRSLSIPLPPHTQKVILEYTTGTEAGKRASGLQWLPKEQTFSGKKPFFFTQGQYFHNRGLLPLQDTPAAKITAEFKISVKHDLGIRVVAASNEPHNGIPQIPVRDGDFDVWTYRVTQPVSPYLLTIAAGEMTARKISSRSILYAEPHLIDMAAKDYEHYDKMLIAAEELFGTMPWVKMDTLIMPPSFPYGGMENLGINMNSNTIITGDKSLMDVAVHEFIHSWFGNLVTNTRLEDFWLNEGFTMYAQRAVMEKFFGADAADTDAVLGRGMIEEDLSTVGKSRETCMATKSFCQNSDDAISSVPYEKGYLFVKWLEDKFGKEAFLEFLKGFLNDFAFKNLTSEEFADYVTQKFPKQKAGITRARLDEWLYGPGLPDDTPIVVSASMDKVRATVGAWNKNSTARFAIETANSWSVHMWTYLLEQLALSPSTPAAALDVLHTKYKVGDRGNPEISRAWFSLAAKNRYTPAYDGIRKFLDGSVGRLKMIRPVLVNLKDAGEGALALEIYKGLRPKIHAISHAILDPKLGYNTPLTPPDQVRGRLPSLSHKGEREITEKKDL